MSDLTLPRAGRVRRGRAVDALLVGAGLLGLWQAVGDWTGGVAIAPPWSTLAYTNGHPL